MQQSAAYQCSRDAKPSPPGEEPAAPKLRLQLSRTRSCSAWMSVRRGMASCRPTSAPGPGGDAPRTMPPQAGPCMHSKLLLQTRQVSNHMDDGFGKERRAVRAAVRRAVKSMLYVLCTSFFRSSEIGAAERHTACRLSSLLSSLHPSLSSSLLPSRPPMSTCPRKH